MTDLIADQKQKPILFIHGFGSCGSGTKAEVLRNHFGENRLIAPDLPVDPTDCIEIIEGLISKHQPAVTISSSLGSFYATWLNQQFDLPAVLINPAVDAPTLLKPHIGKHTHWCTGEVFELTEHHIEQLSGFKRSHLGDKEKYLVLLQDKDEILDYRDAVRFYQGQQVVVEKGGNHRFENLQNYLQMIELFIKNNINQGTLLRKKS